MLTPLSQGLQAAATRYGASTSECAAVRTIEVVLGPALALLIDAQEMPTSATLVGGTLVVTSVLLVAFDAGACSCAAGPIRDAVADAADGDQVPLLVLACGRK